MRSHERWWGLMSVVRACSSAGLGELFGHANEDKQEEEAAGEGECKYAHKEDERDTGGDRKADGKQKVEGNACKPKGDANQSCGEDVGGECHMHPKQDEEADAFVEVRGTAHECEEDTERARHVGKLSSFQFQDPEAPRVPVGMWLAQWRTAAQHGRKDRLRKSVLSAALSAVSASQRGARFRDTTPTEEPVRNFVSGATQKRSEQRLSRRYRRKRFWGSSASVLTFPEAYARLWCQRIFARVLSDL
ncbi:hypothetical protein NDU88_005694 [Pleurodeles waltl]|uniref:Uncharacterized protein n=1 Tax=Pleurodeles waltl TaxID=8319 RepID=A0AAV7LQ90_PLEWA|nr:hypothetical protein NDU88_005694 [Pleurodeles waltl]